MIIESVLSHMRGWELLHEKYPDELQELSHVLQTIVPWHTGTQKRGKYNPPMSFSTSDIYRKMKIELKSLGWEINNKLLIKTLESKSRYTSLDVIKNFIGIEIEFAKFAFTESNLFVKFPLFIKAQKIELGIVIMPMKSLANQIAYNISDFDMVSDRILLLPPLQLQYPFVIIGVTSESVDNIRVVETTSELDYYLITSVGHSLIDMSLEKESNNYDFKQSLPNNTKLEKVICSFANLDGGGLLLLGIDDNCKVTGYPRHSIDDTKLRISQIVRDTLNPPPILEYTVFDIPDDPAVCILAVKVSEILRKPCMTQDRVFIRDGASSRPANSDEIRRLLKYE